eukprot:5566625-Prymnesium_polylepis.1
MKTGIDAAISMGARVGPGWFEGHGDPKGYERAMRESGGARLSPARRGRGGAGHKPRKAAAKGRGKAKGRASGKANGRGGK